MIKLENFADQASFPKFSRRFNFADFCDTNFTRDQISEKFADLTKKPEISEIYSPGNLIPIKYTSISIPILYLGK